MESAPANKHEAPFRQFFAMSRHPVESQPAGSMIRCIGNASGATTMPAMNWKSDTQKLR